MNNPQLTFLKGLIEGLTPFNIQGNDWNNERMAKGQRRTDKVIPPLVCLTQASFWTKWLVVGSDLFSMAEKNTQSLRENHVW